jgi:hypothetical protein
MYGLAAHTAKLISLRSNWHFPRPSRGMKPRASKNDDACAPRLCRLDVKAPLHLIEETIVFVDLLLHPINFFLLQVVHCENDRDKIDYRHE